MEGIQSKKRKRESVITARECGWDTAYEDDMSVEGSVDQQSANNELDITRKVELE
jgi:hypothetical protein